MYNNFSTFCNSKMIADQSAFQSIQDLTSNHKVDVLGFLENKGVSISTTQSSIVELSYPNYSRDLFSTLSFSEIKSRNSTFGRNEQNDPSSTLCVGSKIECVMSRTTGSLTLKPLEPGGFPVEHNFVDREEIKQLTLWDSSFPLQRIKRKSEKTSNYTDVDNFILARKKKIDNEKFFIFVSDEDQLKQCQLEGYDVLMPRELLFWMETDDYITKQKNSYIFKSWKNNNHTSGWAKDFEKFNDFRSTLNIN